MKRNLSPEEEAFVSQQLSERPVRSYQQENGASSIKSKQSRRWRRFWLFRPIFWAVVNFVIPFFAMTVFLVAINRVESFVGGAKVLKWFANQKMTSQIREVLSQQNLSWLPEFLKIYQHRAVLIAGLFTVFFVIAAGFLVWEVLLRRKEEHEKDSEE